jgi:ribosome-binding protein aMBF1 (putative translation factor)
MNNQDWEPVILNKINKEVTKKNEYNSSNSYTVDDIPDTAPKISLSNCLLIQKGRSVKKLTQAQVAKQLNIDVNLYKKYENGLINPAYNILIKIEKVLNIKLNKKKTQ